MEEKSNQIRPAEVEITGRFVPPPPPGYVTLLAREAGVDVRTVTNALQGKTLSRKALQIRQAYMKKYVEPYL